jgi:hypothetical protein
MVGAVGETAAPAITGKPPRMQLNAATSGIKIRFVIVLFLTERSLTQHATTTSLAAVHASSISLTNDSEPCQCQPLLQALA